MRVEHILVDDLTVGDRVSGGGRVVAVRLTPRSAFVTVLWRGLAETHRQRRHTRIAVEREESHE